MTNGQKRGGETAQQRQKRLAAELRANLQKRKAQARARSLREDENPQGADRASEETDAT